MFWSIFLQCFLLIAGMVIAGGVAGLIIHRSKRDQQ
jgi:hypothetical protein